MRSAFSLVLAVASLFATVGAVPADTPNVPGTIVKGEYRSVSSNLLPSTIQTLMPYSAVWPNGVVESKMSADEYFGTGKVDKRQVIDLVGATCQSTCSGAPGTGPNQADCSVIVNQMWSEGTQQFSVSPSANVLFVTYRSCKVTFVNFTGNVVVYQDNDWGSVANYLAGACNAAHGFAAGKCTFDEANAFIQSSGSNGHEEFWTMLSSWMLDYKEYSHELQSDLRTKTQRGGRIEASNKDQSTDRDYFHPIQNIGSRSRDNIWPTITSINFQ
ncbi:hypothetical protein GALMADRAFT_283589, partial [Galerina marginata CBS 339.88]